MQGKFTIISGYRRLIILGLPHCGERNPKLESDWLPYKQWERERAGDGKLFVHNSPFVHIFLIYFNDVIDCIFL